MRCRFIGGALLLAVAVATAAPGHADAPRTVLPIHLSVVPKEDHKQVYSIPVEFGKLTLEAVLSTGSLSTLVLPDRVNPSTVTQTGASFTATYGGNRQYTGDVVSGVLRLRQTSGQAEFGIVKTAQCLPNYPQCPIAGETPQHARFGQLFPAIVGMQMAVGSARLQNVLSELGVSSYLITAPTAEADGQLVLNPTANETSTFVPISNSPAPDVAAGSVNGCIKNLANHLTICGAVSFDTSQTDVIVYLHDWTQSFGAFVSEPIQLQFTDGSGNQVASVDFKAGETGATHVFVVNAQYGQAPPFSVPFIRVGQIPYLGFKIATDLRRHGYLIAPRPSRRGQPMGHVP